MLRQTVVLLVSLYMGACSASLEGTLIDAGAATDGAADERDGGSSACAKGTCATGQVCYAGTCVRHNGACGSGGLCLDDSFCHASGYCVPYGKETKTHDPTCKNSGFTPEQLAAPVVKCSWTAHGVMMSPVVVDLSGDGKPEIVFTTYQTSPTYLVAISGTTCAELFKVATTLSQGSQLAAGDLTGDKVPELVGITTTHHVQVFDAKGTLLATSDQPSKSKGGANCVCAGGAAIANLDGQGAPEVVYGGMALRLSGGKLTTLFNVPVVGGYVGVLSAVADVDLDGKPEIVAGNRILDGQTGADETPAAVKGFGGGYVAVGQLDKSTPEPEIVLVSSVHGAPGTVRAFHPKTGQVVFGPYTLGTNWGGPPTIADFDGDGAPEISVAGNTGYAVYDPGCAATPLPAGCQAAGLRWSKSTQDLSSGCTGSSVFDFNGDGKAEVVYRDECWLRVYDGTTGKTRFASAFSSATWLELPVIVDLDGDSHAEMVVTSDSWDAKCKPEAELGLPAPTPKQGVFVVRDPKNRWMPSRGIWNQHTYHITNVNDDGTVPPKEKNNWDTWNNFRQNVQGSVSKEVPAADLTGHKHVGVDAASDCVATWVLLAELCNRGAATAAAGIEGTFYLGDPRAGGKAVCSAKTTAALAPGACETVKCSWSNPPQGQVDLWFAADSGGASVECDELNNLLQLPKIACPGTEIE